jgi:hypothetical protein
LELDGAALAEDYIPLADDGQVHNVRVVLGEKPPAPEPAESKDETTHKEPTK